MSKRFASALSLAVIVCLGVASVPAQASEVVKLARLVLTGKRTNAEDHSTPPAPATSQPADVASGSGGGGDNDNLPANAATGTQRRSFVKSS